jgi:hypothetical protein
VTTWPTVMVTGHRPQYLSPDVHDWVRFELNRLAVKLRDEHGMTTGVSGMAIGADLWWADALVSNGVPLWAHVPFPQQPDRWSQADRAEWQRLLGLAAKTTTNGPDFDVKLLHARNDAMIRSSSAAIAVWLPAKHNGGTASAVRFAAAAGGQRDRVPVLVLARMTFVEEADVVVRIGVARNPFGWARRQWIDLRRGEGPLHPPLRVAGMLPEVGVGPRVALAEFTGQGLFDGMCGHGQLGEPGDLLRVELEPGRAFGRRCAPTVDRHSPMLGAVAPAWGRSTQARRDGHEPGADS